jgi:tetratricopeptide (TPR) repeat protein/tRNA A-37 threonylcarbamoyl transferase component Bud32
MHSPVSPESTAAPGARPPAQTPEAVWREARVLFDRALDLPPVNREALKQEWAALAPEVSADSAAARQLAARWLAAHEGVGPVPLLDDAPPRMVGPFAVDRLLGRGGMGEVYLAHRTGADFEQQVALKILRRRQASPALEARLAAERRILARLEHPAIARFIDGGLAADGRSYVAMEYVSGRPLREWVQVANPPLAERLAVFREISDAVGHAHQRLVVHRDLKPGNILVTSDGRVKLLDFGVAALLDAPDTLEERGDVDRRWLTPAYASPEQARGDPPTTQSDVYALGVILFELLTDQRPYEVSASSLTGLARELADVSIPAPSRVHGGVRRARPLDGDLDAIVQRATQANPAARYASVDDLLGDLTAWQARRPVSARPLTAWYALRCFVRRHRVGVLAGTLATLALLVGATAALWQARLAAEQRDAAESARDQAQRVSGFLAGLFDELRPNGAIADTGAARALLALGVERADALAANPLEHARVLDVLGRRYETYGRYEEAMVLLTRAHALRERALGSGAVEVLQSLLALAAVERRRGEYARADSLARVVLQRSAESGRRMLRIEAHESLARTAVYLARPDLAVVEARAALALQPLRGDEAPELALRHAETLLVLGESLRHARQLAAAESVFTAARRLLLTHAGPTDARATFTSLQLADLEIESGGDSTRAAEWYRDVIAVETRSRGERQLGLIHPLRGLAELAFATGNVREAERLLRRSLAIRTERLGADHPVLAEDRAMIGRALHRQGRLREADSTYRDGVERARRGVGAVHVAVAGAALEYAGFLSAVGRLEEAERQAREALSIRRQLHPSPSPQVGAAIAALGDIARRRGQRARADSLHEEALRMIEPVWGRDHELAQRLRRALPSTIR